MPEKVRRTLDAMESKKFNVEMLDPGECLITFPKNYPNKTEGSGYDIMISFFDWNGQFGVYKQNNGNDPKRINAPGGANYWEEDQVVKFLLNVTKNV